MDLPPKAFEVLLYLLRHPGRLVSKEELLRTIWAETYVGDAVLKVAVGEIRKALGDNAKTPQFVETVHRRGYRFIAPLNSPTLPPLQRSSVENQVTARAPASLGAAAQFPASLLVRREAELRHVHYLLDKVKHGERQVLFVTGEPGIGKTTLIEEFLREIGFPTATKLSRSSGPDALPPILPSQALLPAVWVARGQCVEHYGTGETYLPVFEVLRELSRHAHKEQMVQCLAQYAPTWLAQLPALTNVEERQRVQQEIVGATPERMLREGVEAVEALSQDLPLVIVLEDLHWSDYATLDLLAALARRREHARLFVIGTYRPVDVIVSEHPMKRLKAELHGRGQCEELALGLLSPEEVARYLTQRFPESLLPEELAVVLHRHTDGNPLFLTNVVEFLIAQGVLHQQNTRWVMHGGISQIAAGMPENTRQVIERQIERLTPDEQQVLEVASVMGMEFPAVAIDAALEEPEGASEPHCERLMRQQRFLSVREPRTWPDGTVTGIYAFTHALYQSVLVQRVATIRKLRLHQRIGKRLEAAYGEHADRYAAELAVHFEHGRDYSRAVHYLQLTAENAVRRYAYREALHYLLKGLQLISQLADTAERTQCELRLQATLGPTLMALKGTAAPEVEHAYRRAQELCSQTGETTTLFPILRGLFASAVMQGKLATGRKYAEQLLHLAQSRDDSALLLQAHYALGMILYRQGEFMTARTHLEKCQGFYDARQHFAHALFYGGADPGVGTHCFLAWTLWYLGYADQALTHGLAAVT